MNEGQMPSLAELEQAWDTRGCSGRRDWNSAADSWERKYRGGSREAMSRQRIDATVQFLVQRGVLTKQSHVLDAGCGPGRFAAEFARRCACVTGVDISEKMCRYGEAYCAEQGLGNVSFLTGDFSKSSLEELGISGTYDLAFSSITPAVRGLRGLDNLIGASSQWCFNASFIRENNQLINRVRTEVFGVEPRVGRGMHADWFHMLFHILWLRGYDPELYYYEQNREIRQNPDEDTARVFAEHSVGTEKTGQEEVRAVKRFLEENAEEDGCVTEISAYKTAWMLWNVNDRD